MSVRTVLERTEPPFVWLDVVRAIEARIDAFEELVFRSRSWWGSTA